MRNHKTNPPSNQTAMGSFVDLLHGFYREVFGSFVPGAITASFFVLLPFLTFLSLSNNDIYVELKQLIGVGGKTVGNNTLFASALAVLFLILSYAIGGILYRRAPKYVDAVASFRQWCFSSPEDKKKLTVQFKGKRDAYKKRHKSKVKAYRRYEKDLTFLSDAHGFWQHFLELLVDSAIGGGREELILQGNEIPISYPYPFLRSYLLQRGLSRLAQFVGWCYPEPKQQDKQDLRSKNAANLLKYRIRYYGSRDMIHELDRNECNIRMLNSLWFSFRFVRTVIFICVGTLFVDGLCNANFTNNTQGSKTTDSKCLQNQIVADLSTNAVSAACKTQKVAHSTTEMVESGMTNNDCLQQSHTITASMTGAVAAVSMTLKITQVAANVMQSTETSDRPQPDDETPLNLSTLLCNLISQAIEKLFKPFAKLGAVLGLVWIIAMACNRYTLILKFYMFLRRNKHIKKNLFKNKKWRFKPALWLGFIHLPQALCLLLSITVTLIVISQGKHFWFAIGLIWLFYAVTFCRRNIEKGIHYVRERELIFILSSVDILDGEMSDKNIFEDIKEATRQFESDRCSRCANRSRCYGGVPYPCASGMVHPDCAQIS